MTFPTAPPATLHKFLTGNNQIAITCASARSLDQLSTCTTDRTTLAGRPGTTLLTPGTTS